MSKLILQNWSFHQWPHWLCYFSAVCWKKGFYSTLYLNSLSAFEVLKWWFGLGIELFFFKHVDCVIMWATTCQADLKHDLHHRQRKPALYVCLWLFVMIEACITKRWLIACVHSEGRSAVSLLSEAKLIIYACWRMDLNWQLSVITASIWFILEPFLCVLMQQTNKTYVIFGLKIILDYRRGLTCLAARCDIIWLWYNAKIFGYLSVSADGRRAAPTRQKKL